MKTQVSYLLTKNSVTLHYDGKTKVVAKDDGRFEEVLNALREKRHDEIPAIVEPELYFESQGLELDLDTQTVKVQGEAMPAELNTRIVEYKQSKLPFQSLLNFWENLKKNPSFNSRAQLFKFLENKGHSITEDGCFIGYRGVREDFKDRHTGTFDNKPGSICSMPREKVDDNPANTCSHGFHVGGYEYAKEFGPKLVLVKVNPMDVVAVPNDYNGQKMRVCQFEVLKEVQNLVSDPVVTKTGEKSTAKVEVKSKRPELTPTQHKKRYANNHAKRGPNGKFIAKKKTKKRKSK